MSRSNPATIAQAILTAPAWARVGITAPSEWLREDAAQELARSIIEKAEIEADNGSAAAAVASQMSFKI